jgi:hypothetical protein
MAALKGVRIHSLRRNSGFDFVLKGRGFSRAVSAENRSRLYSMLKNSDFGWRSVSTLR